MIKKYGPLFMFFVGIDIMILVLAAAFFVATVRVNFNFFWIFCGCLTVAFWLFGQIRMNKGLHK